jgi:hypothetical protein
MHDSQDRDRTARLAEIVEYTRQNRARQDGSDGAVHIHYHEAERPQPPPPPEMDIASKYAGHFVLLLGGCVILTIIGVIAALILPMIAAMLTVIAIMVIAVAVGAVAVVAAVRSLRQSGAEQEITQEALQDLRDSRPKRKGQR